MSPSCCHVVPNMWVARFSQSPRSRSETDNWKPLPPAAHHRQICSSGTAGKWGLAPSQGPGKMAETHLSGEQEAA